MPMLHSLKNFNLAESTVLLWTFKKNHHGGSVNFTGRWIDITDDLRGILKDILSQELERVEELLDFSLLAQNNESSLMTIETIATHGDQISSQASEETDTKRINSVKHIQNAEFYVAKFVSGEEVLLGVKKTDTSWKTQKKAGITNVLFKDQQLDVSPTQSFDIASYFDFMIFKDTIFINKKNAFESVLSYKQAHIEDFNTLCTEDDFSKVFTCLAPIKAYVGSNKMQLRRATAIREKGHYLDPAFLQNLRERHEEFGLTINFDCEGKIVPDEDTCADIFIALLDHRLSSGFSQNIYDVQDTSKIQINV